MTNHQLFPRTGEEARIVIPFLEELVNKNFKDLETVRESSGEILQIKKYNETIALSCARSNITYYMENPEKSREGLDLSLEINKVYEENFLEGGEWIARHLRNGSE